MKPGVEAKPAVKVKDVMTAPVITVPEDETIDKVAKAMRDHNIGSIVVVDGEGNPVGIITEKDIVGRVVVKNVYPSNVRSKDVMSSPLATASPELSVEDAARMMNKLNIRRLIVMDKGKLIGILTSKEILAVTPALIEIILEKAKVSAVVPKRARASLAGYCEGCGQWSDLLDEVEGRFLCEDCVVETGEEE